MPDISKIQYKILLCKGVIYMIKDDSFESLLNKIREYMPNFNSEKLYKAYELASSAHGTQKRISGTPYISHPVAVANIVADMKLDTDSICAALLHDVVEDTEYTSEDIKEMFGSQVALLVDGVTKLDKIQFSTKEERDMENLRKMFLAMASDIRVIIIKFADRVHNMTTLISMSEEKQREKARETLMDILSNYVAYTKVELVLVFDAYLVKDGEGSDFMHDNYRVVYTRQDQTADAFIEKMMHDLGPDYTIRMVSGDKLLQFSAVHSGISRMTAKEFYDEVVGVANQINEFLKKMTYNL